MLFIMVIEKPTSNPLILNKNRGAASRPGEICGLVDRVAVLASGGLDSAVLLADLARSNEVFPINVRVGLAWEEEEARALAAFVATLNSGNVQPVTTLTLPIEPFYGNHWGVTGQEMPGAGTEDNAVFLPGRNILLVGLAAVWCSTHEVSRIAIGSLGDNPFPDASPDFFRAFGSVLSRGLAHQVAVEAPYRGLHKHDLIRDHRHLPLELTVTCLAPKDGVHCGVCNKCDERQRAFGEAGTPDRTRYAARVRERRG